LINRAAIILKYKQPAIDWINSSDPCNDNPGITINSANEDSSVYLIRDEDADTPDRVKKWIKLNHKQLFESELEGWYTDDELWPKNRTLKMFYEWFDVECHSVIHDTVYEPILDDDTEY